MKGTIAAAFAACSVLTGAVSTRVGTSASDKAQATADVQAIAGEWRSSEQFDNRPRATLAVQDGAGRLTGTLTLLGLTNGDDDRATLHVPFREAAWDGTTLSFETVLPDGEPTTRWTLRVTAPDKATLGPLADDGRPEEGGPTWEMSRRSSRRAWRGARHASRHRHSFCGLPLPAPAQDRPSTDLAATRSVEAQRLGSVRPARRAGTYAASTPNASSVSARCRRRGRWRARSGRAAASGAPRSRVSRPARGGCPFRGSGA